MKYSETKTGRVFVIRLEDGDILHETLEQFAIEKNIKAATVIAVGGVDVGSVLVTGPKEFRSDPIVPMEHILTDVREATGTGTIFPDDDGKPILHMHLACGREQSTITGCVRRGVKIWHVLEVVMTELVDCTAGRPVDPITGFKLLIP